MLSLMQVEEQSHAVGTLDCIAHPASMQVACGRIASAAVCEMQGHIALISTSRKPLFYMDDAVQATDIRGCSFREVILNCNGLL